MDCKSCTPLIDNNLLSCNILTTNQHNIQVLSPVQKHPKNFITNLQSLNFAIEKQNFRFLVILWKYSKITKIKNPLNHIQLFSDLIKFKSISMY